MINHSFPLETKKGVNYPLLAFFIGYRQVTCTYNKHEQFTPIERELSSACPHTLNVGGIHEEENKSKKLKIHISSIGQGRFLSHR